MQRVQRRAILGEDKTIHRFKERFNWPGYSDDVSGQRHVRINRGNEVWGFRMTDVRCDAGTRGKYMSTCMKVTRETK